MREFLSDTLETALMAMVIFLLLQAAVQNFRVEGPSMVPTLNNGEHLLVNKLLYLRLPSAIAGVVPGFSDDPNDSHYLFRSLGGKRSWSSTFPRTRSGTSSNGSSACRETP